MTSKARPTTLWVHMLQESLRITTHTFISMDSTEICGRAKLLYLAGHSCITLYERRLEHSKKRPLRSDGLVDFKVSCHSHGPTQESTSDVDMKATFSIAMILLLLFWMCQVSSGADQHQRAVAPVRSRGAVPGDGDLATEDF